jgi:myosin heavy subunit
MPVKKGRIRSAMQAESSSLLIPNKTSVHRTVWVTAHEETGVIDFDGVDGQAYWRLANVVAGAPLHSETAESSDARVLVVVCEGDDPSTHQRAVPINAAYEVDGDELCSGDDLAELHHLNEPNVVHGLALRFAQNRIYTFAGPILISINPWTQTDIYSAQHAQQYMPRKGEEGQVGVRQCGNVSSKKRAPHVFAVAAEAFRSLAASGRAQSILVSGESGSGKTETCKHLMQHLALLSSENAIATAVGEGHARHGRQGMQGIEKQVLESNPILEAFGNAKTSRNDNSSRFGKFTQLLFHDASGSGGSSSSSGYAPRGQGTGASHAGGGGGGGLGGSYQLRGGVICTYLLERTRVVCLAHSERSYHFFYQLLAAASAPPSSVTPPAPALPSAQVLNLLASLVHTYKLRS